MKSDKGESQYEPGKIEPKWPFRVNLQGKQEYDHKVIESYWQGVWEQTGVYEPDLKSAKRPFGKTQGKPFYNLMMFPYPSAEGLHVGNMYAFCGSDIYGRYMRMRGFDVFEPIGLDGFGIHSENYALKIGQHPVEVAKRTEMNFYRQLHAIGNGFSWTNKLETYKSNYYKWTQWIFVQLFKAGLAYKAKSAVNWCPHCLTVLADEQVVAKRVRSPKLATRHQSLETISVCERCGTLVVKKELAQWFFRITKYAQRLLDGLDKIDWSEKVKIAQRNWLGKSEGVEILFPCDVERNTLIPVFTTRADTIFGVTYLALAPEHPLVTTIIGKSKGLLRQQIQRYVSDSLEKSEEERIGQVKQPVKTGIKTGFHAINPINGKKVPVFIADYVLATYGTGAVMGVPAHDQRDREFAKKFELVILPVIHPAGSVTDPPSAAATRLDWDFSQSAFCDYGVLVNSGKFSGMTSRMGIQSIIKYLKMHHSGSEKATWHLRDWIISRQRYWGPPIPMIFCDSCRRAGKSWFTTDEAKSRYKGMGISNENLKFKIKNSADWNSAGWYPVPEEDLPVELPYIKDFKPTGKGVSPLAQEPSFVRTSCPECGSEARRETDVSDTFLDSAWYFLRYTSIDDDRHAWTPERVRKWLPVNMYIGGAEHAVLHLLYARFVTKAFYDLGLVDFDEPFVKFRTNGLLIKDGAKMSKSKGNVVTPDRYIEEYGADTLRCYLMFCGRFTQGGDFRDSGIEGMSRFLKRVWRLAQGSANQWVSESVGQKASEPVNQRIRNTDSQKHRPALPAGRLTETPTHLHLMHKTIKRVTEDIESLDYNTAIAALMEWVNALEARVVGSKNSKNKKLQTTNYKLPTREEVEILLLLLAPFAPHMTEELWQQFFGNPKHEIPNPKQIPNAKIENSKIRELVFSQSSKINGKWKMENGKFASIHLAPWPKFDPKLATAERVVLVVEVNGRVRDKITVERGISENKAKELALALPKVTKHLDGKKIKRVIFVSDRLINFVIEFLLERFPKN